MRVNTVNYIVIFTIILILPFLIFASLGNRTSSSRMPVHDTNHFSTRKPGELRKRYFQLYDKISEFKVAFFDLFTCVCSI